MRTDATRKGDFEYDTQTERFPCCDSRRCLCPERTLFDEAATKCLLEYSGDLTVGHPVKRRLYRSGQTTSQEAAEALVKTGALGRRQREALTIVQNLPGRTAMELARAAKDQDPRMLNRRLPELARDRRIRKGDARTCTVTGRMAFTWWPE